MITIDRQRTASDLVPHVDRLFDLSAGKIDALNRRWDQSSGAPVFTVNGNNQARGWTDWTQGFQFGSSLLQFDATGDTAFLEPGRAGRSPRMTPHLTHIGVHDHGFNTVSTYGALWRLAREGRFEASMGTALLRARIESERSRAGPAMDAPAGWRVHPLVQRRALVVRRYDSLAACPGARSLPSDIVLFDEQDRRVSLLGRLVQHARATAAFSVYHGRGRDAFDVRGRVTHEAIFNVANGSFRSPSTQQGYSPFSTWTRGLAWAILGFAEQLEFLATVDDEALIRWSGRAAIEAWMLEAARATSDYYIAHAAAADGVPYWDTGAPGLAALGDWGGRAADPFNDVEPVDSSAAAIAAQGLLRLARSWPRAAEDGSAYLQAGLRTLDTLFNPAGPYLATVPSMRDCCCTRSTTGRTVGTTCRRGADAARRIEPVG